MKWFGGAEIIRQGTRFGVRLRLLRRQPITLIGSGCGIGVLRPLSAPEKQSEDLVSYLLEEFKDNPDKIWESNIFGKSLHSLVQGGIQTKLGNLPRPVPR